MAAVLKTRDWVFESDGKGVQLPLTCLKATVILWSGGKLGVSLALFHGITFNGILFGYWLNRLNKHFGLLIFNLILIHVNSLLWKFYFIYSSLKPFTFYSGNCHKTGLSRGRPLSSSLLVPHWPEEREHSCSVIYGSWKQQQLLNWEDQQHWLHMKERINVSLWSRFDPACPGNKECLADLHSKTKGK